MTSDLISQATDGYPCHACLMSSQNPINCTHCGAKIELADINEATFKPPEYGTFFVPSNSFSYEPALDAIMISERCFYQNYIVIHKDDGILVSSNHIAYQVFSTIIGEKSNKNTKDITKIIPFKPEIARGTNSDI